MVFLTSDVELTYDAVFFQHLQLFTEDRMLYMVPCCNVTQNSCFGEMQTKHRKMFCIDDNVQERIGHYEFCTFCRFEEKKPFDHCVVLQAMYLVNYSCTERIGCLCVFKLIGSQGTFKNCR